MKSATPELIELLGSKRQFATADLFTITRKDGGVTRVCSSDVPIYWEGEIYSCYGLQASGVRYRTVTGLEADEQTLTLSGDRSVMLGDVPYIEAIQNGALDGARIKRARAYMEAWVVPDIYGVAPVGCITLFSGFVSSIDSITRSSAELRVKSDLALLDISMPRNSWQAGCINTLYDSSCGLNKDDWASVGVAEAGSTDTIVYWSGATAARFWGGTFTVTSGENIGQTRTVKNSTGTQLVLSTALPHAMSVGDTFMAYPGCDHTMNACTVRFGNLDKFRGFPFIPTTETAL